MSLRAARSSSRVPDGASSSPFQWVDTTRYLRVTLDKRHAWAPRMDPVRKEIAQTMGMLDPLLNRKSDFSVRKGVLLYKQIICPMMDYASPAWRSPARIHVRVLQVLQSKCFRLATDSHWYVSNRQMHEDLGILLFAEHIRATTARFDSRLGDVCNNVVRLHGKYLLTPTVDRVAWREKQVRQVLQASRAHRRVGQVNYKIRVRRWKKWHGPHCPHPGAETSPTRIIKFAYLQFATEPVWAQKPESHSIKFYPAHISLGPPRRKSLAISIKCFNVPFKSFS